MDGLDWISQSQNHVTFLTDTPVISDVKPHFCFQINLMSLS